MLIYKEFGFEAAHFLPSAPKGTANARIHGHSFQVRVTLKGGRDKSTGLVYHFSDLEKRLGVVKDRLDHHFLNEDVEGLEIPTLENIAVWIWAQLEADLPNLYEVHIWRPSCGEGCLYYGKPHVSKESFTR